MPLEAVTYISDLVATNPVNATDQVAQGDDHIRNLKTALLNSFPGITGAMTATHTQLNQLASLAAVSVLGRSANSAGAPAAIAAAANDRLLTRVADVVAFSQLTLGMFANDVVANAALANMAADTFKGRATGAGAGDPTDLTAAQAIAIFNAAGTGLSASILSTGSLPDARLSSQVVLKDTSLTALANTGADHPGYSGIPMNPQNAGYTAVLADANKCVYASTTGTFTIPAHASVAYPVGTTLTFINFTGGANTIALTTETLVFAGAGTTGSRTLANNGIATAIKIANTHWMISGPGLS